MTKCLVCNGHELRRARYLTKKYPHGVPALECARCGALEPDERDATSREERESVRAILAARAVGA